MTDGFYSQIANIASTFSTDTIFVLGKGPSVDRIDPAVFANSLVIGINDAERIVPVDITLLHDEWVIPSLRDNGFRSRLYLAPDRFDAGKAQVIETPFVPLSAGESDMMIQRLLAVQEDRDFVLEEVQFITALKLARVIALQKGQRLKVYMVGFDFNADKGYSRAFGRSYVPGGASDRAARITPQEFFFVNALYMLRGAEIDVLHVGERSFSALSPDALNGQLAPRLGGDPDRPDRVMVTAELTTNHFGDRHRLERMIRAARAGGADLIKLQKRDVESFYSRDQLDGRYISPFGTTFRDYRQALELDRDDFGFVDQLCRSLGIGWFVSVLDEPSYRFIRDFDPGLIKLPSTISEHRDFLERVARDYRGELVLSTGMTDTDYEDWVLSTFTDVPVLWLMQANSAYPTPDADCGVGIVRHYRDLARSHPRIRPAYSSHDAGWFASTLAVAAGARMVEKHVKLGNTEWAHFDVVALDLTTSEFRDYVARIRDAETIVGSEEKQVRKSEHHKYFRRPTQTIGAEEAKP